MRENPIPFSVQNKLLLSPWIQLTPPWSYCAFLATYSKLYPTLVILQLRMTHFLIPFIVPAQQLFQKFVTLPFKLPIPSYLHANVNILYVGNFSSTIRFPLPHAQIVLPEKIMEGCCSLSGIFVFVFVFVLSATSWRLGRFSDCIKGLKDLDFFVLL